MSTSYQHESGRWTHGKRTVKALLRTDLKSEDFGYGKGGEVYQYSGGLFVQIGNMTWSVGPAEKTEVGFQKKDHEKVDDLIYTADNNNNIADKPQQKEQVKYIQQGHWGNNHYELFVDYKKGDSHRKPKRVYFYSLEKQRKLSQVNYITHGQDDKGKLGYNSKGKWTWYWGSAEYDLMSSIQRKLERSDSIHPEAWPEPVPLDELMSKIDFTEEEKSFILNLF